MGQDHKTCAAGVRWQDLLACYPPSTTCFRRFQLWVEQGVFRTLAWEFADALWILDELDMRECFIDGTFTPAKAGGAGVGKTKRGKGSKIMVVTDRAGLPVSAHVTSAQPYKVTLVDETLAACWIDSVPEHLIGDRAYDSDALDARQAVAGIELIALHRRNRRVPTQDGRALRRYRRRWKVERTISWLQRFRRLGLRYEYYLEHDQALIHLACAVMLLLRILK